MSIYEAYKSTDVEWVNSVPKHWQVTKLKLLGNFTSSGIDKLILEDEGSVKMVNYMDVYGNKDSIINSSFDFMVVTCPDSKREVHNVIKGDLIFTPSSETIEDIGLSALIDEDLENTVYSYHVLRFRFAKKLEHKFKKYLCNNFYVLSQFSSNAKGTTRQILSREEFKNIVVFIPTPTEQLTIAKYLDNQTQKIDRLIANKKAQTEKLKELRQIEINIAVTKGLNPNAELKDSGIDWLGKIPKHWQVKRLKNVSEKITDGEHIAPSFTDGGMPFLSAKDVRENEILFQEDKFVSEKDGMSFRQRCNPERGDALIVSRGATVGRVSIVKTDRIFCLLGSVILIKPTNKINSEFLFYALTNPKIQENLYQTSQSSAQQAIYLVNISFLKLAIPPIEEQIEISRMLVEKTKLVDSLIKNIETQIEKLQELRKIKIYEAVTGKIKVNAYVEATA